MSETYGFGAEDELSEPAPDAAVAPKFYRDYMDKVSKQLQALQDRNDALEAAQRQQAVREALTAKGYAPEAANLYTGKPEGLNDWLTANAAALAKVNGEAAIEAGQGVQGTPQSVVSPEDQAAMAKMAAAGQDGAAPLGGEDQLAARLAQANSIEDMQAIMREQGSKFV